MEAAVFGGAKYQEERSSFLPFFSTAFLTSAPKFLLTICLLTDRTFFFQVYVIPREPESLRYPQAGIEPDHERDAVPRALEPVTDALIYKIQLWNVNQKILKKQLRHRRRMRGEDDDRDIGN